MNIIIVGCGRIGSTLVEELSGENHDISIIDEKADVVVNTDYKTVEEIAEEIVVARHKTSNMILTLAYGLSMISDNSLGNKSVGMIGSWHLFSKAIPILNKK